MPVLTLDPMDTLLLRDGRPFNQDDVGLTRAFGHFPPFPWITASAIRAAYARTTGWSEAQGRWQYQPEERRVVLDHLGDGLFDTGDLTFDAPLLAKAYYDDPPEIEPLFPCPAHVLGRERSPGDRQLPAGATSPYIDAMALSPDLVDQRLTDRGTLAFALDKADAKAHRPLHGHWITAEALRHLLAGGDRIDRPWVAIIDPDSLATPEVRIGLERDQATHRAVDGMLYSASHRRTKDGIRLLIRYRIEDGSPLHDIDVGGPLPLGGQGRMVMAEPSTEALGTDHVEPSALIKGQDGMVYYMIVLTAPMTVDAPMGENVIPLDALPGELVASAHDRQVTFAGWNQGTSMPFHRRYWPAGSAFFFRSMAGDTNSLLDQIRAVQRGGLGADGPCRTGCGRFLIGTWQPAGSKRRDD